MKVMLFLNTSTFISINFDTNDSNTVLQEVSYIGPIGSERILKLRQGPSVK